MGCWNCVSKAAMSCVYGYQNIRHNNFLARRSAEAGGVEAVGEFFLTPAHFLFAGKTVTYVKESDTYTEQQSYDYSKYFWLKTVAAIIALPISLIIGSIFKGISLCISSVRERNAHWHERRNKVVINEEYYKKIGLEFSEEEFVPPKAVVRPTMAELERMRPELAAEHKAQIEALKHISKALTDAKVGFWLDAGTLLGAYRHGGIIPWDADVDISVLAIDHQNVMNALRDKLDPDNYDVFDSSGFDKPGTYVRVYIKAADSYIDIYHYASDIEGQTVNYIFSQENSSLMPDYAKKRETAGTWSHKIPCGDMFPLKPTIFDGVPAFVPNHVEKVLQGRYPGTLDPAKVWNPATGDYEKVAGHPYWEQSDH